MIDLPQELVDRVAEAFWNEGRCETNWSFAEMLHLMEDPDADVPRDSVEWIRGKARAGIAAMLDGVTLEWGEETPEESHAETAIGRYSIYCIMRGGFDDEWYQFLNGAGPGTSYETLDAAKAAVFADYRARVLKAMIGGS